ncbi:DUF6708 domain-containing protein [Cupriavidus sp. UGS-1]|uniref:DUF6708 domain-containing protein n=1 Tax=Cupriavidus sp. UGS-1 TaxID=2899826 RepID=UPI001E535554|nr:DUF6708 domain-containing protein [Cupriavidus sp. UGS-1]MCD9121259.1 hypothetical protein [Cupriavidus sp. UGS-1]
MDFTGLVRKYRVNRPIDDDERAHRLRQGQRLQVEPHDQLCVIKINSSYLDSVDRYYDSRGALTLMALVVIMVCVGGFVAMSLAAQRPLALGLYTPGTAAVFLGFVAFVMAPIVALSVWMARRELGRYTHYPIRLDRRNRMLHVFRLDGSILSVRWDDVFFTLGRCSGSVQPVRDIRGLVLDRDGVTVREQFAFSLWEVDPQRLKAHWEFLRRYMEEGPKDLIDRIRYCVPIDGRRERFRVGLERVFANDAGSPPIYWLMWPFNLLLACTRALVMRTCRVPVWPKDIEEAAPVSKDDPYVKDASSNPPNLR